MTKKWPDFAKELEQARGSAHLTQQELADRVGEALKISINQQTVSYWCRGETLPRGRDIFLALCRVLHDAGALPSAAAANRLLRAAEQGALHDDEIGLWLPDLAAERGSETQGQSDRPDHGQKSRGAPDSPDEAWAGRLIASVEHFLQPFARLETRQATGVIIVSTLLLAAAWRFPAQWQNHPLAAALLIPAQWLTNLLLAWPPSSAEHGQSGSEWLWRKLYRLSGVAAGVMVAVGVLFFTGAFVQVIVGFSPARWLSFLVLGAGVIFAYAGGLKVQAGAIQVEDQGFYRRASAQVTLFVFLAQALLPVFFVLAAPQIATGYLVVLSVALALLWPLLRRR
ncbi:MAG: helix-turn-helix domain-containing protein [Caldilineales bacterium]|nr:helix-turn-helix domain-containing protein [Caldilineales bacterium]MCW5858696.1 helix-turn-helix transcriptional regulator [Caldilineales bacterium]